MFHGLDTVVLERDRNFQGQRFTYKQPKLYDGSETPDIVPIEIAAKKQRTAAKKACRPRLQARAVGG